MQKFILIMIFISYLYLPAVTKDNREVQNVHLALFYAF